MADFRWVGRTSGSLATASNWDKSTNGGVSWAQAVALPTSFDDVSITNPAVPVTGGTIAPQNVTITGVTVSGCTINATGYIAVSGAAAVNSGTFVTPAQLTVGNTAVIGASAHFTSATTSISGTAAFHGYLLTGSCILSGSCVVDGHITVVSYLDTGDFSMNTSATVTGGSIDCVTFSMFDSSSISNTTVTVADSMYCYDTSVVSGGSFDVFYMNVVDDTVTVSDASFTFGYESNLVDASGITTHGDFYAQYLTACTCYAGFCYASGASGCSFYGTDTEIGNVSIPSYVDDCDFYGPSVFLALVPTNSRFHTNSTITFTGDGLANTYDAGVFVRLFDQSSVAHDFKTLVAPSAGNVKAGVVINGVTGTLTVPPTWQVLNGVTYGSGGNQFTGTIILPVAGNVENGIGYGANGNQYVGVVTLPAAGDVRSGVMFGAGGIEHTGTLVVTPRAADITRCKCTIGKAVLRRGRLLAGTSGKVFG